MSDAPLNGLLSALLSLLAVSLPGEIFVELGLSIKAASPFQRRYLAELANGAIGCIPNRPAYLEGNYESVSARMRRKRPGACPPLADRVPTSSQLNS